MNSYLHRTADKGWDRLDDVAPGYPEQLVSWVNGLTEGPPRTEAQTPPRQDRQSVPLAPLSWYESAWVQAAVILILLIIFAGYLLTVAVNRLRHRTGFPVLPRPARWLAATGLVATIGLPGYFHRTRLHRGSAARSRPSRSPPSLADSATPRRHHRDHRGGDRNQLVARTRSNQRRPANTSRPAARCGHAVHAMGDLLGTSAPLRPCRRHKDRFRQAIQPARGDVGTLLPSRLPPPPVVARRSWRLWIVREGWILPGPPPRVFVSYARKDLKHLEQFEKHVAALRRSGVEFFDDRDIEPGSDWERVLFDRLDRANVVVLLGTASFFASDF